LTVIASLVHGIEEVTGELCGRIYFRWYFWRKHSLVQHEIYTFVLLVLMI